MFRSSQTSPLLTVAPTVVWPLTDMDKTHYFQQTLTLLCLSWRVRVVYSYQITSLYLAFDWPLGAIQEERSVVNINASDSTATLRCMLYGYLPSGQEPSILWGLNGAMLRSSNVYTITTEDGDRLIQNGGPQPIPSLTSTLTINLTLFPVIGSLAYTCFSSQASSPAFKTITVMSGE